jgi:hypothetical protein
LISDPNVGEQVATALVFNSGASILASKNLLLTRLLFLKFSKIPRYIARISDA